MHRTSVPGCLSFTWLATESQLFPTPKAPALIRIPPAGVDVAGAVGHVHLVAGVHARVLLLVLAPDAAREVLHQGLVLRAQLRAGDGAAMDAGFRVETAATSFQVDQDTLARVGGV